MVRSLVQNREGIVLYRVVSRYLASCRIAPGQVFSWFLLPNLAGIALYRVVSRCVALPAPGLLFCRSAFVSFFFLATRKDLPYTYVFVYVLC